MTVTGPARQADILTLQYRAVGYRTDKMERFAKIMCFSCQQIVINMESSFAEDQPFSERFFSLNLQSFLIEIVCQLNMRGKHKL